MGRAQMGQLEYDGTNDDYGYLDPGIPGPSEAYTEDIWPPVVRRYNVGRHPPRPSSATRT